MPVYLSPGVYVEEFAGAPVRREPGARAVGPGRQVRSRWEAEHGTAAFLGWARRGPEQVPTQISSSEDFQGLFGPATEGGLLAEAVDGFFGNGGRSAWIVRLPGNPTSRWLDDLLGDPRARSGLTALEPLDDVSFVVAPDVLSAGLAGLTDRQGVLAAQVGVIAHCELMGDRIALLDAPPDLGPKEVTDWRTEVAGYDTGFGALFWPWLEARTPEDGARPVPPSGHVAGLFAAEDHTTGPDRAPVWRPLSGASGLRYRATKPERDYLHPRGVNSLVVEPDGAVVLSAARTLSSDPVWRQLSSRRLMAFLVRNLTRRTRWAMAERSDDRAVWAQLAHDVDSLFRLAWRAGALPAERAEDAFEVWCDDDSNAPGDQPGVIRLLGWVRLPSADVVGFRVLWVSG